MVIGGGLLQLQPLLCSDEVLSNCRNDEESNEKGLDRVTLRHTYALSDPAAWNCLCSLAGCREPVGANNLIPKKSMRIRGGGGWVPCDDPRRLHDGISDGVDVREKWREK